MTTLAEHIIVAGAENRPPMLEKSMYDSWVSRIRLFIKGKKHGRMMLDSIDNGHWFIQLLKKMGKLDLKNTSNSLKHNNFKMILINDMHAIGMTMQQVQVNTKFLNALSSEWSKFVTDVKLAKRNRGITTTSKENVAVGPLRADPGISEAPVAQQTIPPNSAFQTDDLDAYDSDCDDLSLAKAVLMANLSSCDPEVLSKVPYSNFYLNDLINQDVQCNTPKMGRSGI
ncbi:hypothetical protein Tco_0675582 [Tanacetum coccineum]